MSRLFFIDSFQLLNNGKEALAIVILPHCIVEVKNKTKIDRLSVSTNDAHKMKAGDGKQASDQQALSRIQRQSQLVEHWRGSFSGQKMEAG